MVLLPSESNSCSNQICGIWIRISTAKPTAKKSIHRSKLSPQRGPAVASWTGGSEKASSGSDGCAAKTAVNGGSRPLIFVPPRASNRGLSLSGDIRRPAGQRRNRLSPRITWPRSPMRRLAELTASRYVAQSLQRPGTAGCQSDNPRCMTLKCRSTQPARGNRQRRRHSRLVTPRHLGPRASAARCLGQPSSVRRCCRPDGCH